MADLVNILDILVQDRDLPAGYDSWAVKTVKPDFRTRNDFRWPFPGGETEVHALDPDNSTSCPAYGGDGLCVAADWAGMASGGIPAHTLLLVAYRSSEAVGDEPGKLRVPQAFVVDLFDGERLVRGRGASADLRGANLYGADLYGANLTRANLRGAYLTRANLRDANLYGADLRDANLTRANLRGANLDSANLRDANLIGANLDSADLRGANLTRANLYGANLYGANLRDADLRGADLRDANLPEGWEKQVTQNG